MDNVIWLVSDRDLQITNLRGHITVLNFEG
jgi:hypothetical protein